MILELACRALGDASRVPLCDNRERVAGPDSCLPASTTRVRSAEKQLGAEAAKAAVLVAVARIVRCAVFVERDGRASSEIASASPGYVGIIGILRHTGQETVRNRRSPGFASIKRCIDRTPIVVVPVVGADDDVLWIGWIYSYRSFILGRRVVSDVNHSRSGRSKLCYAHFVGSGGTV